MTAGTAGEILAAVGLFGNGPRVGWATGFVSPDGATKPVGGSKPGLAVRPFGFTELVVGMGGAVAVGGAGVAIGALCLRARAWRSVSISAPCAAEANGLQPAGALCPYGLAPAGPAGGARFRGEHDHEKLAAHALIARRSRGDTARPLRALFAVLPRALHGGDRQHDANLFPADGQSPLQRGRPVLVERLALDARLPMQSPPSVVALLVVPDLMPGWPLGPSG